MSPEQAIECARDKVSREDLLMKLQHIYGLPATIHMNLHKGLWSIRHKGKVIDNCNDALFWIDRLHVSETGRQRVIRNQRREVHAWICGRLELHNCEPVVCKPQEYTYNPFRSPVFHDRDTGEAFTPKPETLYWFTARENCFKEAVL